MQIICFRPRHPKGHPVIAVPDSILRPGTSVTPANSVQWGYYISNVLPKNSLKDANSWCTDFDIGQGGEGRFTT